jgi:hypothetical protein
MREETIIPINLKNWGEEGPAQLAESSGKYRPQDPMGIKGLRREI